MTIRPLIYCLFCFLCPFPLIAQVMDFDAIGIESGLPSNEVYSVYQDREGYIWAFTEYGIVRHNGVKFIPVCTNIPFSESAIYKVSETGTGGMLLVNSNAKVYKVENDKAVLIKGMEKLSAEIARLDETILEFLEDGSGNYLISTHTASYRFHAASRTIEKLATDLTENEIRFRQVGDRFFIQRSMREYRAGMVLKLTDRKESLIWSLPVKIGSQGRQGVFRAENDFYMFNKCDLFFIRSGKSTKAVSFDMPILNMERDEKGHVWIAMAYDGLYELDKDLNILNHYLEGLAVSGVTFDNQSGMWISTIGNGIFYCNNIHRKSWNRTAELSGCISLLKICNGKLFIGTAGGGLFKVENGPVEKTDLKSNISYVNDIIFHANRYYVGTKMSIIEADERFGNVKTVLMNFGGYGFAKGLENSILIVSASLLFEKFESSEGYKVLARGSRPRHIVRKNEKDYLISLRHGLALWNGKFTYPAYLSVFRGKNISSLTKDKNENTWICTKGDGVYKLSAANRITHFKNLPSSVVLGICFSEKGSVLLSTNKGVYVNASGNLNNKGAWKLVQEGECTAAEEYKGNLYIASRHGLSVIAIEDILQVPDCSFYFSSLTVNGKPMRKTGIRLTREQDDLFFQFDLLNYRFPYRQLIYRLKGASPGKGSVNGTELHLQNLKPGNYELTVIPVINSLVCKQKAIVIPFYVAPAFYETGIFIGLLVFLLIVVIVLITSMVFIRLGRKEAQRRKVTRTLAKYRLAALKAQVNPHFISNVLSAIQLLMLSGNNDKAGKYIARFSLLIRYLLNYSDKTVASLESELNIIDLTIELEQLRFTDRFEFRKEIGAEINAAAIFIPPLITQPFIENAIWHGLLPLDVKYKPLLILEISKENTDLVITITDNGVGRSGTEGGNRLPGKESRGTALMQSRMETLNVLHSTNGAGIFISDLKNDDGTPSGTRVRIVFPSEMLNKLSHEHNQEHYS